MRAFPAIGHRHGGPAMPHLLDPLQIESESAYLAALDELEDLMATDPGTPAGRRFDELVALIEDYEARHCPPEMSMQ
jgi:antitoxin component HigA of HigAB toxin-antitoxin module